MKNDHEHFVANDQCLSICDICEKNCFLSLVIIYKFNLTRAKLDHSIKFKIGFYPNRLVTL